LRAYGISVVVLYYADEQRLFPALGRLVQSAQEWDLLRIDGRALVFGWRGGRPNSSFAQLRIDPNCLAFGPADADAALEPAPSRGPQRAPRRLQWWEHFLTAAPAPGWQSDAATMYLRYFEDLAPMEQRQALGQALACYATGLAGLAAAGPPEQVVLRLVKAEAFLPEFRARAPDVPLLAVRAARLALADNPDDVNAWLRLGQAYLTLHQATGERAKSSSSPLLGLLRHVQAATALEHALLLDPDLEAAHEALSLLYGERVFLDAALEHRRHALRLMRRGPRRGETEREFEDRLKAEEQAVVQLEKLVQDRKNEYTVRSRSMSGDPLGRAQLALSQGLARLALDDVLLQSPVQSFGGEGARLQLELLLQFGRAEVVREMLDDQEMRDSKEKLDLSRVPAPARPGYLPSYRLAAYEWLRFLQAAATGDYDPAAEALEQVIQPLAENGLRSLGELRRAIPLALGTELGLAAGPEHVFLCHVMFRERGQLAQLLSEVLFIAAQRADLHVLGALLAAERGRPADALKSLDKALAAAADRGPPADFAAEPLAAAYRRRLVLPHGCGRETNPVIRKGTPARPD
jgi:hypothetical protein